MSEQSLARRQRAATWWRRRGVELGELWSIFGSGVYAWRAVYLVDGRPVAPLTSHIFLNVDNGVWFWVLVVNGFAVFAAMLLGLLTGNTYRIRSYVSLASSVAWVLITIAAVQAHNPPPIAVGYFGTCVASWITALILSQKAVYNETKMALEGGQKCADAAF